MERMTTAGTEETDNKNRTTEGTTCSEEDCNGSIINTEDGETVCNDCGLVYDDTNIDRGPDWRSFEGEENKVSRAGSPTTVMLHDKGLNTRISRSNRDEQGNQISDQKRHQINRLRKWNKRLTTKSSKERGIKTGINEIERISSALGLSTTVKETAAVMFKQCSKRDLLMGRSLETVAAVTVYLSTRECGNPRTPNEFYPLLRVNENYSQKDQHKKFDSTTRYLIRELNLKAKPADPTEHIPRYTSRLQDRCDREEIGREEMSNIERKAKKIVSQAPPEVVSGPAPSSIAAAAIYAASQTLGMKITQTMISDATNVTSVTIRNYYTKLLRENQ